MSNYKNYLLRAMGIKESHIKPSNVNKNPYPDIDPDELEMGTEEERDEHGLSSEKAKQTATDHLKEPNQGHYYSGMKDAKNQGMLRDSMFGGAISPTAIPTPVIGLAVRGSNTGGLPSGIDRFNTDISPSCLGGYEKIPIEAANSKLVDGTPKNTQIDSDEPIASQPEQSTDATLHPHQTQHDAGKEPQAVTGASTDSNDSHMLKQNLPKGIDIDIAENEEMNKESYVKNQENLQEGKHKPNCKCGFCSGKFGKKKSTEEDKQVDPDVEKKDKKLIVGKKESENVDEVFARHKQLLHKKLNEGDSDIDGADDDGGLSASGVEDVDENKQIVNKEKTGLVRLSEAFERMRGLANLGERRVLSNGLWGPSESKSIKEDKWMQSVEKETEKKGTKGALRKELGVSEKQKIPTAKLKSIRDSLHAKSEKKGGQKLTEKELTLLRRVVAALNMRGEG